METLNLIMVTTTVWMPIFRSSFALITFIFLCIVQFKYMLKFCVVWFDTEAKFREKALYLHMAVSAAEHLNIQ